MAYTVHITAGDPQPGLWCDTCLLPSVVMVPLYQVSAAGVGLIGDYRVCVSCGSRATDARVHRDTDHG